MDKTDSTKPIMPMDFLFKRTCITPKTNPYMASIRDIINPPKI